MNDSMDRYIGRSLKNWAAQKQPPANSRARLLLVAASQPKPHEPVDLHQQILSRSDHDGHFVPLASNRPPAERVVAPFSQPTVWPMHIALFPFRALNFS
jgi:hypothetical protein